MSFGRAKLTRFNEMRGNAPTPGPQKNGSEESSKHGHRSRSDKFTGCRRRTTLRSTEHGDDSARSPCTSPTEDFPENKDCCGEFPFRILEKDICPQDEPYECQKLAAASGSESQSQPRRCPECDIECVRSLKRRSKLHDVVHKVSLIEDILLDISEKQKFTLHSMERILQVVPPKCLHPHETCILKKECEYFKREMMECMNRVSVLNEVLFDLKNMSEAVTPLTNVNLKCSESKLYNVDKENESLRERNQNLKVIIEEYRDLIVLLTTEVEELENSRDQTFDMHLQFKKRLRDNFIHICNLKNDIRKKESELVIEKKRNEVAEEDYLKLLQEVSILNVDERENKEELEDLRSKLEILKINLEKSNSSREQLFKNIKEAWEPFLGKMSLIINDHNEKYDSTEDVEELNSNASNKAIRKDSELSVVSEAEKKLRDYCSDTETAYNEAENALIPQAHCFEQVWRASANYSQVNTNSSEEQDSPRREFTGHGLFLHSESVSHDPKLSWMTEVCSVLGEKLRENKEKIRQLEREREENINYIQYSDALIKPFKTQLENYQREKYKYHTLVEEAREKLEAFEQSHVEMLHCENREHLCELEQASLKLQEVLNKFNGSTNQKERALLMLKSTGESSEKPENEED